MASKGAVKTITVLDTLSLTGTTLQNAGTDAILITGKEGGPGVLTGETLRIDGQDGRSGPFQFENITVSLGKYGDGVELRNKATVIFGKGCVITSNSCGITVDGNLTLTDDALIIKNTRQGIRLNKGTVTMSDNATISENGNEEYMAQSNDFNGGGVYMDGGSVLTMRDNAKITDNIARNGGGVYIYNRCDYSDGLPPSISMEGNAMIVDNTAQRNGGGIWIRYETRMGKRDASHKEPLLFTGKSAISGNKAKMGGGIFIDSNISIYPFTLTGGNISVNTAEYGAGVYFMGKSPKGYWTVPEPSSESFVLKGAVIQNNNAEFVGGGLYMEKGTKYVYQSGTLSGNTAGDGDGENIFGQQ
jgi:hypothetical protein